MRKGLVILALGLVVAVLSVGVVTWAVRNSGPPVRVVSREGGFSVAVPKGWSVEKRRPSTDEHREYLVGHENAAFGFLQRGGFWVARWAVGVDASTETVLAHARSDQRKSPRDNWTVRTQRLARHAAVVTRFTEPAGGFERVRLGGTRVVIYDVINGGFDYQVGLWTRPAAGGVKDALHKIAASIELFAPRAWTADLGDTEARLRLPGGWAKSPSELKGTLLHALAPNNPTDAWVYVFQYKKRPARSLDDARTNITANGGAITGQRDATLGGRKAVRLDFTFPDEGHAPAHDTEWFVSDRDGGTFVLAVGVRNGDPNTADRIASGWRF